MNILYTILEVLFSPAGFLATAITLGLYFGSCDALKHNKEV